MPEGQSHGSQLGQAWKASRRRHGHQRADTVWGGRQEGEREAQSRGVSEEAADRDRIDNEWHGIQGKVFIIK